MTDPIAFADIGRGPPLKMLSIGDDIVAETYRISGAGAFEPASLTLWFELARRSVYAFDVGAFTGIYALVAANANPSIKIAAIEPTKHVFARLCLNIQLNGFHGQIAPLNFAAGASVGDCLLNHYDGIYCLDSGSTLQESGSRPFWFSEAARMLPLDVLSSVAACDRRFTVIELPQTAPDIVKIDVEGLEIEVLCGMRQIIERSQPIFILECLSEKALRAASDFLSKYAYGLLLIDDESRLVIREVYRYSAATRNILFYPLARQQQIEKIASDAGLFA